jgi:hypothetical protein
MLTLPSCWMSTGWPCTATGRGFTESIQCDDPCAMGHTPCELSRQVHAQEHPRTSLSVLCRPVGKRASYSRFSLNTNQSVRASRGQCPACTYCSQPGTCIPITRAVCARIVGRHSVPFTRTADGVHPVLPPPSQHRLPHLTSRGHVPLCTVTHVWGCQGCLGCKAGTACSCVECGCSWDAGPSSCPGFDSRLALRKRARSCSSAHGGSWGCQARLMRTPSCPGGGLSAPERLLQQRTEAGLVQQASTLQRLLELSHTPLHRERGHGALGRHADSRR